MVETKLFDLSGKVALLTGASKGMGRAMAEGLASHGAKVIISSRTQGTLDQVAAEINETYGEQRAFAIAANAGRKEELQHLVDKTRELAGPIDILVGNAGINIFYGNITDIGDDAYEKIMKTNVQANLWLAKMVSQDMINKGAGSMMFTSSIGAFKPSDKLGVYGMSKLALIGLVRNLALEYGPMGIRSNAICPGLIRTDFSKALWDNPEALARANSQIPLRRLGEAEDFSGLAVFLASDSSRYITGQAMTVCGGTDMWN